MPEKQYNNIIQNMGADNNFTVMQPQAPGQPVPRGFFQNPYVRALGYVGLGAGLSAGYHYRDTIKKLGQKAINYTTDKFHHLFNPPNSTNSTQSENRTTK